MSDENTVSNKPIVALVGFDDFTAALFGECNLGDTQQVHFVNAMKMASDWVDNKLNVVAIISFSEIMGPNGLVLIETLKKKNLPAVPFFLIVNHLNANLRKLA